MRTRNLLLMAVMTGAALTGAGAALMTHSQPTMQQLAQIAQPAATLRAVPPPELPPFLPPAAPAETSQASPLRSQIRRAIHERDLTLLKSLVRAGVLREMLRNPESSEQVNFENLDASAWRVLEKAVDYRCRHLAQIAPASAAQICFE